MFSLFPVGFFLMHEWLFFLGLVQKNTFPSPLSPIEEEKYINKLMNKDKHARNTLIEHNLRLVAHIAKKYQQANISQEDLISIGTIGLIKGIDTYQKGKGSKLATYAARCIENELLMYFRSLKKVNKDVSLYQPIGHDHEGNEIQLFDVIQADNKQLDEIVAHQMEWDLMSKYIHILNEREKCVIEQRFGVNGDKVLTQREIAKRLNISRSYVSRIEKRALLKLFRHYEKNKYNKRE